MQRPLLWNRSPCSPWAIRLSVHRPVSKYCKSHAWKRRTHRSNRTTPVYCQTPLQWEFWQKGSGRRRLRERLLSLLYRQRHRTKGCTSPLLTHPRISQSLRADERETFVVRNYQVIQIHLPLTGKVVVTRVEACFRNDRNLCWVDDAHDLFKEYFISQFRTRIEWRLLEAHHSVDRHNFAEDDTSHRMVRAEV